jgi:hypothetical protein
MCSEKRFEETWAVITSSVPIWMNHDGEPVVLYVRRPEQEHGDPKTARHVGEPARRSRKPTRSSTARR